MNLPQKKVKAIARALRYIARNNAGDTATPVEAVAIVMGLPARELDASYLLAERLHCGKQDLNATHDQLDAIAAELVDTILKALGYPQTN